MVMLTLILIQVIFGTSAVLASGKAEEEKRLRYIGSFPTNVTGFDINNYFISANPTTWSTAAEDCGHILGPNGGLLAIETIAEWEFLRVALEQYGYGTTYWTSGFYDFSTSVWRWTINNYPLPPYPPWGAGQPTVPITTGDRIQIWHTSRYDAYWRTLPENQLHRYICEFRRSPC